MASLSSRHAAAQTAIALHDASIRPTYACPTCDKSFKRPSTLNEHIRATHTSDRLICAICEKAFKRANDLKRHEKLHSGEKAFACHASIAGGEDVGCRKRFARLHSLREHQRRRIGTTCWDAFVDFPSRQACNQPIHPSDISWHSVLESRLRHDAESIIASSRNSSFSSTSSCPVSTSS